MSIKMEYPQPIPYSLSSSQPINKKRQIHNEDYYEDDDYGNDSFEDDDIFGNDISKEFYKESMDTDKSFSSPLFNGNSISLNSSNNSSIPSSPHHSRKGRKLNFEDSSNPSSSPSSPLSPRSNNSSGGGIDQPMMIPSHIQQPFKIPAPVNLKTFQQKQQIQFLQHQHQHQQQQYLQHQQFLQQQQNNSIFSSSLPTSPISWNQSSTISSSLTTSPIQTNKHLTHPTTEIKRVKPDQKAFFESTSLSSSPSPSPPPTPFIKRYNSSRDVNQQSEKLDFYSFLQSQQTQSQRKRSISMTSTASNSNAPVNINPFTEEGKFIINQKNHNQGDEILDDNKFDNNNNNNNNLINNIIIQEENNNNNNQTSYSLFNHTFQQLNVIGVGSFGYVYKCRHRIDGCLYAIKKTKKPLRGQKDRDIVLREVYGLSAIKDHSHIVRYYNAWEEDSHIFIQMEYCNGGNIYKWLTSSFQPSESLLLKLTKQLLIGIVHIHSLGLVHLDIKPENIYIIYCKNTLSSSNNNNLMNSEELEDCIINNQIIFKIGDLGLLNEATENKIYSEGDSRYLSRELLHDDMSALKKSDIFSLGCTLYELARCHPLPKSGEEWNQIRDGFLKESDKFSVDFWNLLKSMIHPDPLIRPSAESLLNNPYINYGHLSKSDIESEIQSLQQQLLEKQNLLNSKIVNFQSIEREIKKMTL